jgi:hypothetical protein
MNNHFGKPIYLVFREHHHGFSTLFGVYSTFSDAYEEMKTLVADREWDYASLYEKALDVKDGEEAVLLYTCSRRETVKTVFTDGVPRTVVTMIGVDIKYFVK